MFEFEDEYKTVRFSEKIKLTVKVGQEGEIWKSEGFIIKEFPTPQQVAETICFPSNDTSYSSREEAGEAMLARLQRSAESK